MKVQPGKAMACRNSNKPWAWRGPLTWPRSVELTRTARPPASANQAGKIPVSTTESLAQWG